MKSKPNTLVFHMYNEENNVRTVCTEKFVGLWEARGFVVEKKELRGHGVLEALLEDIKEGK
jgi:hypothetical protein